MVGLHISGVLQINFIIYVCYALLFLYNNWLLNLQEQEHWDLSLTHSDSFDSKDEDLIVLKTEIPIVTELKHFCAHVVKDKQAKKLMIYFLYDMFLVCAYFCRINLGFTFIEFIYGYWSNSLGLISDSFHMLFDSTAIAIGLYASFMATKPPTD